MALIIALVLTIVVWLTVADEKNKEKEYENKSAALCRQHDKWVSQHVNQDIESELKAFISDRKNYKAIKEEIVPILESMEHWKDYANLSLYDERQKSSAGRNKRIVLDILLANRGLVSSDSAVWGYKAYLIGDYDILKLMQFELVEWIKNTLTQKGVDVDLVYSGAGDSMVPSDRYYWVGTRNASPLIGEAAPHRFKPFSKDLIKKKIGRV